MILGGNKMGKALLVIDMQNVFVGKNHNKMFNYNHEELIFNANKLIDSYPEDSVFYIINIMKKNLINIFAPFKVYEGTKEAEIAEEINVVSDLIFKKYKSDAFTNKALLERLRQDNIREVEIIGVDGGGCVANTALGAIRNGFKVVINNQCVGTIFKENANKLNIKLKEKGAIFI